MTAIRLSEIEVSYGGPPVLSRLALDINSGEIFGVLGRMGAGKSTLLKILAGLRAPDHGSVNFAHGLTRERISYIFQESHLLPWLNVRENLRICLRQGRSLECRAMEALKISEWFSLRPSQLSGGMKQKINVARGFINEDPLVLLDEPFSHMDPLEKKALQKKFLELHSSYRPTCVFVTHDILEALFLCDRIGFLSSSARKITQTVANPFKGDSKESDLLENPEYRKLQALLLSWYAGESLETA